MQKATTPISEDSRKIAVYARKSKITETGKSVENQITRCKEYIQFKFNAGEKDIAVYIDEGLSGFYSDRPNYLRMLRDISDNKIRALVCYKFDRISRKTIDLLKLVDSLNSKKIDFISCSDDIDTSAKSGKMMITFLATIAEFERDIIAERISDNMYELSKDGRWLGGTTPTGYKSTREYIKTGNKRTQINYLEIIPEEFNLVQNIFSYFLSERSLVKVSEILNSQGKKTKSGRKFDGKAIKQILLNPVYAAADETMYRYFESLDIPVYKDKSEFNGSHGLMVYNKTEQIKKLKDESTFCNVKYVQQTLKRDIKDWITSVGRHPPAVSGKEWLKAKRILQANKDKYIRPNGRTESLLSGLLKCPACGSPMAVRSNSYRYTDDGRLQYRYVCKRKMKDHRSCPDSQNIKGNEIDDFVIKIISSMDHPDQFYYKLLNEDKTLISYQTSGLDMEILDLTRKIDQIDQSIKSQIKNLRSASEEIKREIFEDLDALNEEKEQKTALLSKLKEEQHSGNQFTKIKDMQNIIMSFPSLINIMTYQEKTELLHHVVDSIIVKNDDVHVFLAGARNVRWCHQEQNSK